MTEQTTVTIETTGFWAMMAEGLDHLAETQVSLLTVLVLFVAYGVRELFGLYLRWRQPRVSTRSPNS